MEQGRRLYYDKVNGNLLVDTGEQYGFFTPSTVAHEITVYKELSERNRDTFDVIELEYGQLAQDFAESTGQRVNLEKLAQLPVGEEWKALEFFYPDPNDPGKEPVYVAPLSEEVETLKQENRELKQRTADVELMLTDIILGGM